MSLKLNIPDDIDYSKYNSNSGMATSVWGNSAWKFLFTSIMGNYPLKIDNTKLDDLKIKKAFKDMLSNLSITMPCIFCRESFKIFITELPIEKYLIGRIELMYWLYLMKDKVNKKLKCQENICYNDEKKALKTLYYTHQISEIEYYSRVKKSKEKIFLTKDTPLFKDVLDTYENLRAICSKKAKTCALPPTTTF